MWRLSRFILSPTQPGGPAARRPYRAVLRALEQEGRGVLAAAEVFRQFESFYRAEMANQVGASSGSSSGTDAISSSSSAVSAFSFPATRKPLTRFCGSEEEVEPFTVLLLKVLCDLQKLEEMRFLFTQCVLEITERPPSIELFNVSLLAISMTDTFNQNEVENMVDLMRARGVAPDVVTKLSILILYLRLGQDNSSAWWPMIRDEVHTTIEVSMVDRYPLLPLRILHCFQTFVRLHHDTTMMRECFNLLCAVNPEAATPTLLLPYMVLSITNDAMPPSAVVDVLRVHEDVQRRQLRQHEEARQASHSEGASPADEWAPTNDTATAATVKPLLSNEVTAFKLLAKCAKWKDAAAARYVRQYLARYNGQQSRGGVGAEEKKSIIAPENEPYAALLEMEALLDGPPTVPAALQIVETELPLPLRSPGARPKLFLESRRMPLLTTDPIADLVRVIAQGGVDGIESMLALLAERAEPKEEGAPCQRVTATSLDLVVAACAAALSNPEAAEKTLLAYSAFNAKPTPQALAFVLRSYSAAGTPGQGVTRMREMLARSAETGVTSSAVWLHAALDVALCAQDVRAAMDIADLHAAASASVETKQGMQLLRATAIAGDVEASRRVLRALRTSNSVVDARSVADCINTFKLWHMDCEDLRTI